jgi:hypothetical protein
MLKFQQLFVGIQCKENKKLNTPVVSRATKIMPQFNLT